MTYECVDNSHVDGHRNSVYTCMYVYIVHVFSAKIIIYTSRRVQHPTRYFHVVIFIF